VIWHGRLRAPDSERASAPGRPASESAQAQALQATLPPVEASRSESAERGGRLCVWEGGNRKEEGEGEQGPCRRNACSAALGH
jgi:hypothetical protein